MAIVNASSTSRSVRRRSAARREAIAGYLFLLPNIIGFLVFSSLPVLATLAISTLHWDMIRPPTFIALDNYRQLLLTDQTFWRVLANTVYYVLGTVPTSIVLSLLLAMALNTTIRGVKAFRAIYFLPVISSAVAVAVLWQWLYNSDFGVINFLLAGVGLPAIPWLSSTTWAMPSVIIMAIWKHLGYNMIIYLAGLQGIPVTLYEAAAIDGAGRWSSFRNITIPLLAPTTFFILVISLIQSFQVFDLAFILTRGGPGDATNTVVMDIYNQAFQYFQMGYAAAIAWVLFAIIMLITLVQWRGQKRWVHYE